MKNIFYALSLFVLLFSACNSDSTKKDPSAVVDKESTELFKEASKLVASVDKDIQNQENPTVLGKAATIFLENEQPKKAAETLNRALKTYPNHPKTAENALLLVNIFDTHFPSSGNASVLRKSFIEAFPTHEKAAFFRTDLGDDETPLLDQLANMKQTLADSFNQKGANDFITYAELYSLLNTKKEATPQLVFEASEVCKSLGNYQKSIELSDWFYNLYPTHPYASRSLINKGFLYDEELNKKDLAKASYQEYLTKFPDSPMVNNVKFLLETIDMTEEEKMKLLEEKIRQNSTKS